MPDESQWHLDKRVPISMIMAFVAQTITLVYVGTAWKSDIDHRLVVLEKSDDQRRPQESRIIIVEQQLKFITDSLGWVEYRLGNLAEAARLLRLAYNNKPDVEIGAHLGEVLWNSNDKAGALKVLRESAMLQGDNQVLKETIRRLGISL